MELDEFLYNLHFDIDKVRPVALEVDWEDAPLPFKLYQGLPAVQLSLDVPLSLGEVGVRPPSVEDPSGVGDAPSVEAPLGVNEMPTVKELGALCWYSYGLTQLCHAMLPFSEEEPVMRLLRRYVPSGGGLYPSELYVYLKAEGLAPGVYHYDVVHHRLVLLREGNYDAYLERALGHRVDLSACFATFFVSTMFWKNYYKYNDFSYRLQALDAGALSGQLVEVGKQHGYASEVCLQFLDRAVNHLLGLRDEEESVYAAIPLTTLPNAPGPATKGELYSQSNACESATGLCAEVPPLHHQHYVKSKRAAQYPLLVQMNDASMIESFSLFDSIPHRSEANRPDTGEGTPHEPPEVCIPLSKVAPLDYDFAVACRRRFSPGLDFVSGQMELAKLAVLLAETAAARDLSSPDRPRMESGVSIGVCVHGINGLNDGAYIYEASTHALRLVRTGDHRLRLQSGMSMPTVNFFQVPLCIHLIGRTDPYSVVGYRGYRMAQLEIGMILQRLLLTASALGMNGHPLLGYDEGDCDDIYGLQARGQTCLIEVPIGFYRKTARFESSIRG